MRKATATALLLVASLFAAPAGAVGVLLTEVLEE